MKYVELMKQCLNEADQIRAGIAEGGMFRRVTTPESVATIAVALFEHRVWDDEYKEDSEGVESECVDVARELREWLEAREAELAHMVAPSSRGSLSTIQQTLSKLDGLEGKS